MKGLSTVWRVCLTILLCVASSLAQQVVCACSGQCAIGRDSAVRCWGPEVANVPPDLRFSQLSLARADTSAFFACGILTNASVHCFGSDPSHYGVLTPPFSKSQLAKQVSCALGAACSILLTGEIRCWGRSIDGV